MKEYGLVLGGGGTKGAYQVGVWKALKEMNINIKAITGTSIGAINGALMLQDDIETFEKVYENIQISNIMELNKSIDENKNIFALSNIAKIASDFTEQKGIENTPLREMLEKYVDMDKIYNSDIDFGLVSFSVKDMKPREVFKNDIKKEEMIDYLLASSCFPIFKPQKIEGVEYFDGGLYDNTPINMMVEKGYKNIIVADISGMGVNRRMLNKNVYLKVISPEESLGGTFEFNKEKIKSNIQLGYLDTLKSFNKLQGHIYYFSTSEFDKMLDYFNLQTIYGLEYSANIYKMEKNKIYTTDEFLKELYNKHLEAQEQYSKIKEKLHIKDFKIEIKKTKEIFENSLAICMVMDIYNSKPLAERSWYAKTFLKDYMQAAKAMIELLNI